MKNALAFPYHFLAIALLSCPLNAQTNWTRCSEGLPADKTVTAFTKIGSTLFAGTQKGGVFKSEDNGDSWQAMPPHNSFTQTTCSGLASIDTFLFAGQIGHGVLRTSLHDTAWTLVNGGLSNKVVEDLIAAGSALYAATFGGGVFYSTDLGDSWSVLYGGTGMEDRKAFSLAANSTTLFAGTYGTNSIPDTGVAYRTLFGGTEWTRINEGFIRNGVHLEQVFSMEAADTLVFAGTDDVGLFRSTDNGDHWAPVGGNMGDIYAIKIAGQAVYYGTSYHGTFRSLDAGQTWSENNAGFAFGNVTQPFIIKDLLVAGSTIFAASDIGVFRQTIPGLISGLEAPAAAPEQATLDIYPNPFLLETTLQIYLPDAGAASLRLFETFGREVRTLLRATLSAGTHSIDLDGKNLPAGCYYAVLETPENVVCKKILIVR